MKKYSGQLLWVLALLFLFFMDTSENAFSFCVFKMMGFNSCFGCGIGRSIHHALHFDFGLSVKEHVLGIPATLGILYTIFKPVISLKPKLQWIFNK
ncbi:MAG TPA: DUF2752 domain-containing protein [Bacteroidia bacterium]|nr:DUF2752 domain-containing protein [Bacteroidia bacterium]